MAELAYIQTVHVDSQTEAVTGLVLEVSYDHKRVTLNMHLEPPVAGHTPQGDAVARELQELGMALLRIAEKPSAILPHDPRGN
jgi:hypothetical protein